MSTNNFLPFCPTDTGTNLLTNGEYLASADRTSGNKPGIASSKLVNRSVRQSSLITSQFAQFLSNYLSQDVLDVDDGEDQILGQITAAITVLPPSVQRLTASSGTYNLSYKFFVVAANATIGATYTNNGVTYTVKETIATGGILWATGSGAPLVSGTLTKTSGTGDTTIAFSAFRKPISLSIFGMGAGCGGSGSSTIAAANGSAGTSGGDSTFGTILTAGGAVASSPTSGNPGGSPTVSSPAIDTGSVRGAVGGSAQRDTLTSSGGGGGGGQGAGQGSFAGAGGAASANSGGGGGGAVSPNNGISGSGGGQGAVIRALIISPSATYAYTVGAGGAGGGNGTGGSDGGDAADGLWVITENYN